MKILLAVDGSDHSYEAARSLCHLARAESLTVLHVLDVPKPVYPNMIPEVSRELYRDVETTMKEDGKRLLERVRSLLPLDSGPITTQVVVGSPSDVIAAAAESSGTDLLVMGARGLGPIKERFLGSVSHRVLTTAPCAKLIVNTAMTSLHRVLLPLQGQDDAEAAVRFLALKPFRRPIDLSLLTVLPPTHPPWPVGKDSVRQLEQQALQSAQDFLDDIAGRLQRLGYQTKGAGALGSPAVTILEQATQSQADLILMGSHGRSGVTRFVMGSVSHALLHQTTVPVLSFQ